jgi:hypothetical protein
MHKPSEIGKHLNITPVSHILIGAPECYTGVTRKMNKFECYTGVTSFRTDGLIA